jgi:hypothetical protein
MMSGNRGKADFAIALAASPAISAVRMDFHIDQPPIATITSRRLKRSHLIIVSGRMRLQRQSSVARHRAVFKGESPNGFPTGVFDVRYAAQSLPGRALAPHVGRTSGPEK